MVKMVNPIMAGNIKRPQTCIVKNSSNNNVKKKENREKRVRKRKKNRKPRVRRESMSDRSKNSTNRLPTSLPLNSPLSNKSRI